MSARIRRVHRRRFLKSVLSVGAASIAAPQIVPGTALGLDGSVAPSERIVMGGIGIGNRGTYDLKCFLEQRDVQFVAVCDVKQVRRDAAKALTAYHVKKDENGVKWKIALSTTGEVQFVRREIKSEIEVTVR